MNRRNGSAFAPGAELRLAAYASIAVAVVGIPTDSDATIVFSGPVNINIPTTLSGVYLNVVSGVTGSSSAAVAGWDINPWGTTGLRFFTPTPNPGGGEMVGSGSTYFNLTLDTIIGPGSSFANSGITDINSGTPLHFDSQQNYVGFRFLNESTGMINYGWAQLALSGTAVSQPRSIIGYAYENNGGPIGFPVPEPATAALLSIFAAGAFGVRAWRQRKSA